MQVLSSNPSFDTSRTGSFKLNQVGSHICSRMESVVVTSVALVKLAQFSTNHGCRFITAATTLLVGLERVYNGDIFTGGALAAVGARETYTLLNSDKSDVQRLLQDASAGMDMIKTLEQANQGSIDSVEMNLSVVHRSMLDLEERCKQVRALADHGSGELAEQKERTLKLHQEAGVLFRQSLEALNLSKSKIGVSNVQFGSSLNHIKDLVEIAQMEEGDFKEKAAQFAALSRSIYQECLEAKETLEEGQQALGDGLELLNQALLKFTLATYEAGKTDEMAQSLMEKIKTQVQFEERSESKMMEIKQELHTIKGRNQAILAIADEVQGDIQEAERLAEVKFGYASVILGGGTGAALGAILSGGMAAGAGAVAGTVAYHNREGIGNFIFGKEPDPIPAPPSTDEPVTFAFNHRSSGFWGRYIEKRPSYTKGTLSIDMGAKDACTFKFNLNAKHVVAKKDLRDLYLKLSEKLEKDGSFAPTCLNILNRLSTMTIDRGSRHKARQGFISAKDSYFADLIARAASKCATL